MNDGITPEYLKERQPVAIIDIGSNSIRLVVYEGIVRSSTVLFNEKILCGLGKGIVKTGSLNEKSVLSALEALRRFRALSEQTGATSLHTLATAAAREADNGLAFIKEVETVLGRRVKVLTGSQEAYYSALGILSGFHNPNGIVGDLGGGSLELIDVRGDIIGDGVTLPLGGLLLQDLANGKPLEVARITREYLSKVKLLEAGKERIFYAMGGTWRNLARLHMSLKHYPLHIIHNYEIDLHDACSFFLRVSKGDVSHMRGIESVSKNRRLLLPYGAKVLLETIRLMKPCKIVFSASSVREGYLYSLLSKQEQKLDPLFASAEEVMIRCARSPRHAYELMDWTQTAFAECGFDETENEARYRCAACLLADINWRAHPDYRGLQALDLIAHGPFNGIDHPGRSFMALTHYFRYEGFMENMVVPEIFHLMPLRLQQRAKFLGILLRVVILLSASMPGIIPHLQWRRQKKTLFLIVPKKCADLIGTKLEGRLQQLAELINKDLRLIVGEE